jgi:hypothetical protein
MNSRKDRIKFRPVKEIPHLIDAKKAFGHAVKLPDFDRFIDGLPDVLGAKGLKNLILAMRTARDEGKEIVLGMGAHSIKCGLTPWLLALAREGFITSVAMNGACLIHDIELALCGETSEDVSSHLQDGLFGSADEPGTIVGNALSAEESQGLGLGKIAAKLLTSTAFPQRGNSLIGGLSQLNIPITFHAALGTDTIHFHPKLDWALLGKALEHDFDNFIESVAKLSGGVYINLGSAVILPEVFLKALSIARNTGSEVSGFTTANLDMIQHYRPRENVLKRPGGQAIALTGHHEIMIPLIGAALLSR